MSENHLQCMVVWSDPDLLEIRTTVKFRDWAGGEQAYVTRGEVQNFASALDEVASGSTSATLLAGQRDLSFSELNLREYGRARRLALDVHLGRASGAGGHPRDGASELRLTVPIERGQLTGYAAALRRVVAKESGEATLMLPEDWP